MFINFRNIYEFFFKSFNISLDTKMLETIKKEWVKHVLIIKRSWIFGLFESWILLIIFLIMLTNCYLLFKNFWNSIHTYTLVSLLTINILYWFYSVIVFLYKFKKIWGVKNEIHDINYSTKLLQEWNIIFTKFFNQTIFNYLLLIWITIYIILDFFISKNFLQIWIYGTTNIILLFIQIFLSSKFKKRLIDLQMDFCVIMPWKILIFNQTWVYMETKNMEANKIKTITSKIPNFLWSIFNFWDITILAEWDDSSWESLWFLNLYYVNDPYKTVEEINKLLWWKIQEINKENNFYLLEILHNLQIKNTEKSIKENESKIKSYLKENESKIKNDFLNWSNETKEDIEELYKLYLN